MGRKKSVEEVGSVGGGKPAEFAGAHAAAVVGVVVVGAGEVVDAVREVKREFVVGPPGAAAAVAGAAAPLGDGALDVDDEFSGKPRLARTRRGGVGERDDIGRRRIGEDRLVRLAAFAVADEDHAERGPRRLPGAAPERVCGLDEKRREARAARAVHGGGAEVPDDLDGSGHGVKG